MPADWQSSSSAAWTQIDDFIFFTFFNSFFDKWKNGDINFDEVGVELQEICNSIPERFREPVQIFKLKKVESFQNIRVRKIKLKVALHKIIFLYVQVYWNLIMNTKKIIH